MTIQVGILKASATMLHTHTSAAQGGLLNPETALNPFPKVDFGDGADGDVVIGANTVLTRNMCYKNLTVSTGFYLCPKGFTIRVRGKLKIEAAGAFYDSDVTTAGVSGVGGAGGSGAAGAWSTEKFYGTIPGAGGAGGNGGGTGSVIGLGPPALAPILSGSLTMPGLLWGGAGGVGGVGYGAVPTNGTAPAAILFGAKGGDGGDASGTGNQNLGGGGGGRGGGLILIFAHEIDNGGVINAYGGVGGNGLHTGSAYSGNGGGGGGGAIIIFYRIASGSGLGTRNKNGGAAGTGGHGGTAGVDGINLAFQI